MHWSDIDIGLLPTGKDGSDSFFFNGMKTELDHGSNQLKGLRVDIILGCKIFWNRPDNDETVA